MMTEGIAYLCRHRARIMKETIDFLDDAIDPDVLLFELFYCQSTGQIDVPSTIVVRMI